jgi:two-component system OmpR family sensor kinase
MIERVVAPLSLHARLTLWYSFALATVLGLSGVIVVWQEGRVGRRRIDRELDRLALTFANVLREELAEVASPAIAAVESIRTTSVPGRAIAILDADGRVLAANWNGLQLEEPIPVHDDSHVWTAHTAIDTWRIHLRRAPTSEEVFFLVVAAPLVDVLREQHEAEEALWVGIPIGLLLASAGGLWLASMGLRPITEMARRAEGLAPAGVEDLGLSERRDELGQLARAFNGLLARLRQALRAQREFTADASHELRTPVSVIRSAADVTLSREHRSESEYREALTIVGTEARRIGRFVDDMLVLARADAGAYPLRRANLYLNELVSDCQRTVEILARQRDVTIRMWARDDIPFCGDENLLRRMLVNVMQNAVTSTHPGTAVIVDVSTNGRYVDIRVTDEGDGIPERDRARIFERFVQLDPARRSEGAGLGLPIARWIAEIHGGSLDLIQSGTGGSTFRILLPLSVS